MPTPLTFKVKRLRVDLFAAGISMQQVADAAGVSRITASNVLNGHYVNEVVIEAAKSLLKAKN